MATVQPYFTPTAMQIGAGQVFLESWNSFVNIRSDMNVAAMKRHMQMYGPEALNAEIERAQKSIEYHRDLKQKMLESNQKEKDRLRRSVRPASTRSSTYGAGMVEVDKDASLTKLQNYKDNYNSVVSMADEKEDKEDEIYGIIRKEVATINNESDQRAKSAENTANSLTQTVAEDFFGASNPSAKVRALAAALVAKTIEDSRSMTDSVISPSKLEKTSDLNDANEALDLVVNRLVGIHDQVWSTEDQNTNAQGAVDYWNKKFQNIGTKKITKKNYVDNYLKPQLEQLKKEEKALNYSGEQDEERQQKINSLETDIAMMESAMQGTVGRGRSLTPAEKKFIKEDVDTTDIDEEIQEAKDKLKGAELRQSLQRSGADPSDMFKPFVKNWILETPFTYETEQGQTARELTEAKRKERLMPGEKIPSKSLQNLSVNEPYRVSGGKGLVVGLTPDEQPFYDYGGKYVEPLDTDPEYTQIWDILANINEAMKGEQDGGTN